MDKNVILSTVDHTLLKQTATWEDIKVICEDAMKYEVASVCIPPSFVKKAKDFVGDKMKVCTVIGFPNGYNTTAVKVFETVDAIKNGADEIDMVINLGMVKEKNFDEVTKEIKAIKEACKDKILKVIIETCLLTEEEKIKMCKCVTDAKADFIKTSTGFSTGGATLEDIILFRENIGSEVLIKAAGGIKDLDTAKVFIENGAKRLGTSSIIKIINNEEVIGY
ncbi:deoxyribose-phosphate aldolase [Paraclostridium sordellii]|uniref:deoxyribose-phosphate aldolase n=1 Tax=Paraclostridium sordellii TaxID=1505 RepID=UPI0005E8F93D|nr:deoxyribose-phosphate aldolase [Paeniclostridium sordellii]MCQ4697077.1 deoxyribose-phosphate aldolase [Paeniclostridium sordellii]MDU4413903.1 deoxyribose-phosphate aldolase [Paeniclostridium sordellii]MDU6113971.1 deoxyribose-phosphate aldolase [Paeniclostridium sordellii]MDU6481975.1 deoxyribose-phosphate aldolase [Paeniclostridium sordellii]MRZ29352.1 deoxyribose-phosphate aldolase [Paeniclostridium sordellii]